MLPLDQLGVKDRQGTAVVPPNAGNRAIIGVASISDQLFHGRGSLPRWPVCAVVKDQLADV